MSNANDNNTGPPAAPPAEPAAAPVAMPHRDQRTGVTRAQEFAATLVANYEINRLENNPLYGIQRHQIVASVLFDMVCFIIKPLVYSMHRALGAATITNQNDINLLANITNSVAFHALFSFHAVMYNKAVRIDPNMLNDFDRMPVTLTNRFPAFVTALINSIGPVQFDNVPFRGQHIPTLKYNDISAILTGITWTYNATFVGRFIEQVDRARDIALANTDPLCAESSAWWTFHAIASENDFTGLPGNAAYDLYSPVQFDKTSNQLKLGVLFANQKLTSGPGPINYSASPYYNLGGRVNSSAFPPAAKDFPFFIKGQPAYYSLIEEDRQPGTTPPSSPGYHPVSPSHPRHHTNQSDMDIDRETSAGPSGTAGARNRKRKLNDGTESAVDVDQPVHRMVYYYFDHVVAQGVNTTTLENWAMRLNEA